MRAQDWTDFKNICIVRKNLNIQYEDTQGTIHVVGPDANNINWEIYLPKQIPDPNNPGQYIDNPDVADFNTNVKAATNWAVGVRPYAFATGDFIFAPNYSVEVCPAGEARSVLYQVTKKMYVNGGRLVTDGNSVFGDWVEFQIVDHDNLLGYGVDTVLANWIPKWLVSWKASTETIQTPYAGSPPVGMYFRMTYHSVGNVDVHFSVNYMMHLPI